MDELRKLKSLNKLME